MGSVFRVNRSISSLLFIGLFILLLAGFSKNCVAQGVDPEEFNSELMDFTFGGPDNGDALTENEGPESLLDETAVSEEPPSQLLLEPERPKGDDPIETADIPDLTNQQTVSEPLPDVFFDAEGATASNVDLSGVPRFINPNSVQAQKFILVKKDADVGSQNARIVAAGRAAKLGRYESALKIYDSLYAKNPRDPRILIGKATALQKLNRIEEALQAYQQLLDIEPNNLEARINMLGLMTEKYPAVALRNLEELSAENPNDTFIVAQIAVAHARLGRFNEAMDYLGIASSMEPHNANHLFNMAVIADRAGQADTAIQYYEQALEIDSVYGGGRSIPRESVFERLAVLR